MSKVRYVRLRRYDEKTGHLTRSYRHRFGGRFYSFVEAGIWCKVPEELAIALMKIRQNQKRPASPPVFDVCDENEARRIDAAEKAEREARRAKIEPSVDTAVSMVDDVGRGDLTVEEVTRSRLSAFEETLTLSNNLISGDKSEEPSEKNDDGQEVELVQPRQQRRGRPRTRK